MPMRREVEAIVQLSYPCMRDELNKERRIYIIVILLCNSVIFEYFRNHHLSYFYRHSISIDVKLYLSRFIVEISIPSDHVSLAVAVAVAVAVGAGAGAGAGATTGCASIIGKVAVKTIIVIDRFRCYN
jgi:hypothetical protein